MRDGEGTLSASIFGRGVIGYQRSARTRLPCVSISRTRKRRTNASNNWNWWRFERLPFLTALSGSRYLKPPALPEVADFQPRKTSGLARSGARSTRKVWIRETTTEGRFAEKFLRLA